MALDLSRRRLRLGPGWLIRRIHKISDRRLDRKCTGIYPTAWGLERGCLPNYLRSLQLVVVAGRRPQYGRGLLFWSMVGFLPRSDREPPRSGARISDSQKGGPAENRATSLQ